MPRSWSPCGQQPEREAGAALSAEHTASAFQGFPGSGRRPGRGRERASQRECPAQGHCYRTRLVTAPIQGPSWVRGRGRGLETRGPTCPPAPPACGAPGRGSCLSSLGAWEKPSAVPRDAVSVSPGPHRAAGGSGWHQAGEPGEAPALDTAGHRGGPGQEEWQELSRGLATRHAGASRRFLSLS